MVDKNTAARQSHHVIRDATDRDTLFLSNRWHKLDYCGPGVIAVSRVTSSGRHTQVWEMFATVMKGFANRHYILIDCCPGCAGRTGDMNSTPLESTIGGSFCGLQGHKIKL